jgi:hypothetical protein
MHEGGEYELRREENYLTFRMAQIQGVLRCGCGEVDRRHTSDIRASGHHNTVTSRVLIRTKPPSNLVSCILEWDAVLLVSL